MENFDGSKESQESKKIQIERRDQNQGRLPIDRNVGYGPS
jgi:hypothetical protein